MTSDRGWERTLSRERVVRISVVVLAVNALLYVASVARGTFPFDARGTLLVPDLLAHLTGAALVGSGGKSLYDLDAQAAYQLAQSGSATVVDYFLSPPLAAFLYVPLVGLAFAHAAIVWTALSVALLFLALRCMRAMMPGIAGENWAAFVLAFAASQPTIQLLGSGQDTAVTLLLWCAGVRLATRRRDAWSGAVFALGLFKPQLFLVPPLVLLTMRRWRALGAWVLVAVATAALTLAAVGTAGVAAWLRLLSSAAYVDSLHVGRALRMGSVAPLVRALVPPSLGAAAEALGAVLCLALLWATLGRIARRSRECDERAVWALASIAALLVTPHLFHYDLALLVLPVGLVLATPRGLSARARAAIAAFTVLTWTAAARAPLEAAGWPVNVLAAAWTAAPLFVLWRDVPLGPASGSMSSAR